jgi:hypothetical protein
MVAWLWTKSWGRVRTAYSFSEGKGIAPAHFSNQIIAEFLQVIFHVFLQP